MNITTSKLVLVYNADSGLRNKIFDSAHKIFSPRTYECNLCDITYGVFQEEGNWKRFRKEMSIEMEFLHRDEFNSSYASAIDQKIKFPVILKLENNKLGSFITANELNELESVGDLIGLIQQRM